VRVVDAARHGRRSALKSALAAYRPEQDKEPSYMQRLIQAQTKRDLEWFFDDWVYRDRGLPDFQSSVGLHAQDAARSLRAHHHRGEPGRGGSGGSTYGEVCRWRRVTQRLVVRGKSNGVIRVEVPKPPEEIVVNDGSVPESDVTNNTFKIEGEPKSWKSGPMVVSGSVVT
jgi:hypothetical protein